MYFQQQNSVDLINSKYISTGFGQQLRFLAESTYMLVSLINSLLAVFLGFVGNKKKILTITTILSDKMLDRFNALYGAIETPCSIFTLENLSICSLKLKPCLVLHSH